MHSVVRELPEDIQMRLANLAQQTGVSEDDLLLSFVVDALDESEAAIQPIAKREPTLFPDYQEMDAASVTHSDTNLPFSFIDLFSGVGGLRLGLEAVGGRCAFSCEKDKPACKTYESWFGENPFGDVMDLSQSGKIPDHDLLAAGFPCQPFSIAGVSKKKSLGRAHGFKDRTQGTLFFHLAKIIQNKKPPVVLLENVKNLRSHDKGRTWATIYEQLDALGYEVFDRIIDAADYVPQHRERIFIVGFLRSKFTKQVREQFQFPEPPDGPRPQLASILEHSPDSKYTLTVKLWQYLQDYAEKHRKKGNGFGFGIANPDGITRTLSARYYKDGSEILISQAGSRPRRLTPDECRALMGFPEELEVVVSDMQAYKQFGNSVVPAVVSAVSRQIVEVMKWQLLRVKKNGCLLR